MAGKKQCRHCRSEIDAKTRISLPETRVGVMPFLPLLLFALGGCELIDKAFQKPVELSETPTVEPRLEEQILREFFDGDFAQRKLAHLAQFDNPSFDAVINPRPRIDEVIAKFGDADNVMEQGLASFGVTQKGQVYYYGRLGLITLVNGQEIFWVLIN